MIEILQDLMKRYLDHRAKWSCTCSLAVHCVEDHESTSAKPIRGPTKELDDLGLSNTFYPLPRANVAQCD